LEIAQRPVHGSTSSPRAGMGTNGEWGSGRRAHGCECVDRTGWGEAGHEQPRAPASNSHPFVLSLSKDERGEAGDRTEARSWFDRLTTNGDRERGNFAMPAAGYCCGGSGTYTAMPRACFWVGEMFTPTPTPVCVWPPKRPAPPPTLTPPLRWPSAVPWNSTPLAPSRAASRLS